MFFRIKKSKGMRLNSFFTFLTFSQKVILNIIEHLKEMYGEVPLCFFLIKSHRKHYSK